MANVIGGDSSALSYIIYGDKWWILLIAVVIAYLIGNISPSIIIAKARGIDIREKGSGNAGTTNALRVMGNKAGLATLVIDILKGTIAVMFGALLAGSIGEMWCLVAVFCGHVWPAFYGFRGGKGVATAFGALLALNSLMALLTLGIVIVVVLITKRMSAGSIVGAICFSIISIFMQRDFLIFGTIVAVIVLIKHRQNIKRIFKGEEPKMSIFEKKNK